MQRNAFFNIFLNPFSNLIILYIYIRSYFRKNVKIDTFIKIAISQVPTNRLIYKFNALN